MEKVKISLVVPERIMACVQNYIQVNLLGKGKQEFLEYLDESGVENPEQYLPEMEIGIDHPDDEPVKIQDFLLKEHRDVHRWLFNKKCYSYMDMVLEEHLYSIECVDEINVDPPQYVLDLIQSVKATDCSYFRFVNC